MLCVLLCGRVRRLALMGIFSIETAGFVFLRKAILRITGRFIPEDVLSISICDSYLGMLRHIVFGTGLLCCMLYVVTICCIQAHPNRPRWSHTVPVRG